MLKWLLVFRGEIPRARRNFPRLSLLLCGIRLASKITKRLEENIDSKSLSILDNTSAQVFFEHIKVICMP